MKHYRGSGPALTQLICQCLAAPIAAATEYFCLGTRLTPLQLAGSAVILVGVALAMAPEQESTIPRGHRLAGIAFAVVAAFGQAWGAVSSRYGFKLDDAAGLHVDGMTAAYQRLWGGVITITLLVWIMRLAARSFGRRHETAPRQWKRAWPWIVGNAVAGPTLGVSCYQWALHVAPSAVVLPIVAATPLVVLILVRTFGMEGKSPSPG